MIGFKSSGSVASNANNSEEFNGTSREKSPDDDHDAPSNLTFDSTVAFDSTVKWNLMYQLLKEYQAEHDHLYISSTDVCKGKNLGLWALVQRRNYKQRQQGKLDASSIKMSDERVALLNDIGFPWDGKMTAQESNDLRWNSMYQLLKQYCTERDHVSPSKGELYKDQKLGIWVDDQRRRYKRKHSDKLDTLAVSISDQQIDLLNDIDFIWDSEKAKQASTPGGTQWILMYQLLKDYKTEFKHIFTLPGELYQDQNLGDWVEAQRDNYKLWQKGQLDPSLVRLAELEIALLNAIGFVWEKRGEMQESATGGEGSNWHSMYQLLKDYSTEKKHVAPSKHEEYRGRNLGRWVDGQRVNYRKRQRGETATSSTKKSDERFTLLDEIGFVWELRGPGDASIRGGSKWESMYQLLKDYHAEYNHVTPTCEEVYMDRNLGKWVSDQRKVNNLRLKGKLDSSSLIMSDQRVALLNEVGFVWCVKKHDPAAWENMYKLLIDYCTEHNHVCPPKRLAYKDQNLGMWVYNQRQFYRRRQQGRLHPASIQMTDERIDLLNNIGFVWDPKGQKQISTDG